MGYSLLDIQFTGMDVHNTTSSLCNISDSESEVEDLMAGVALPELPSDYWQRQESRRVYKYSWQKEKRDQETVKCFLKSIDTAMEEVTDSSEESDQERSVDSFRVGDHDKPNSDTEGTCTSTDNMNAKDMFDSDDECTVDILQELENTLAATKLKKYTSEDELDFEEQNDFLPNQPRGGDGTLWADIREAAFSSKMNTVQIDAILSAMYKHKASIHADLPLSHKTLMDTSNKCFKALIKVVSGHQYYYYDLTKQLRSCLARYPEEVVNGIDTLELVWNTDGFPLYNSRRLSSWASE